MAVQEIPISGHLVGITGSPELRNLRFEQRAIDNSGAPEGVFWYNTSGGDKRLKFKDDAAVVPVPRLDRGEAVVSQWQFAPTSPQAPFTLNANAQGQKVTGLNADKLDDLDSSTSPTANTIAARDSNGRLKVADPGSLTEVVNVQYLDSRLAALALDAGVITTGTLALARGGTAADLSGAPLGGIITKGASGLQGNSLTGVVIANGSLGISAQLILPVIYGGTGGSTAETARSSLGVLSALDTYGSADGRISRPGLKFANTTGYKITGTTGQALGTGDWTFSGMFKFDSITGTDNLRTLWISHVSGNNRMGVQVWNDTQINIIVFDGAGTRTDYTITFPVGEISLLTGIRYHIAVTVSRSGNATFYINGQSVGAVSIAAASAINIGSGNAAGYGISYRTDATCHFARVYNSALSATDIVNLVKEGFPTSPAPILDLEFETANPALLTTIKDRSSSANDGTITAGTTQISPRYHTNTQSLLISSMTANAVLYSSSTGMVTALAANSSTTRFLTQASSGAPAWTDLFGGANTWGGAQIFSSTVSISGLTTNTVLYAGASGAVTGLGLNTTGTTKFLTQVSSGAPIWTDLFAASPTWSGTHTFSNAVTVATPSSSGHAATKAYVDAAVTSGIRPLTECKAASTGNLTLSGTQTIDGVSCGVGDRVLAKDQSTPSQNGIYVVAAGAWSRSTDCDAAAEITKGAYTFVTQGTVNGGTAWYQTQTVTTLGTDTVTWTLFFNQVDYVAGTGISIVGQTISVNQSFTPTWGGAHVFSSTVSISGLTTNAVLYAGGSGQITGLALNSGSARFLTQASSGAPVWTDLFGGTNTFTGVNTFKNAAGFVLDNYGGSAGNTTEIRFKAISGSNYVGFKAPDSISAAVIWTLPSVDGVGGTYLRTNGSNLLSWTQITSTEISNTSFLTSLTGTSNRLTVSGTLTPVIDIAATYVGQTSITTLGTIATGTWNATAIGATKGGTGQTGWTAGDLVYSPSSNTLGALAISGSANKILQSSGTAPAWSAYTMPTAVGVNQLLYGSGSNAVSALSTVASRVLCTDGSGNISWSSGLPAGLTLSGDSTQKIPKLKWYDAGDGSSTTITLTHNFATFDVVVEVIETSGSRKTEVVAISRPTNNTVALEFSVAPALNAYRVAVIAQL